MDKAFAVATAGTLKLQGEPTERDGIPIQRFLKDLIAVGTYTHPTDKWKLKVDAARLAAWAATAAKMIANGVEIPFNRDHKDGTDNFVGYLVGATTKGGRLLGVLEARGAKAIEDCKRVNRVSIEVLPNFVDGKGRKYGEAIVGVAITSKPVVPRQKGFVPIAASLGDQAAVGPELQLDVGDVTVDFAKIKEALGTDTEVTEANCVELITAEMAGRAARIAASKKIDSIVKGQGETITALRASLATAKEAAEGKEFSLDPDVADQLAEGLDAHLNALVASGSLCPAARDKLAPILCGVDGARPIRLLSRRAAGEGADKSIGRQILEALRDNKVVATGERTGRQTLSRTVPGDGDEDDAVDPDTQKAMIKTANAGRGE